MKHTVHCDIHGGAKGKTACAVCSADPKLRAFIQAVAAEVERAREKFPSNQHQLLAFAEESGELVGACLDRVQKKGPMDDIHKEAVQAAAMAARVWLDGDGDLRQPGG